MPPVGKFLKQYLQSEEKFDQIWARLFLERNEETEYSPSQPAKGTSPL